MSLSILADADSWWETLSGLHRFFLLVGVSSGTVALVLTVGGFIGLDHGGDGFELSHGDATGDAEGFSLRAITGFFLGFGWVGFACLSSGVHPALAGLAAAAAGLIMMLSIRFAMRSMRRLKSDGTVKIANAVGAFGNVYVTIPGSGVEGGQISVTFDNRHETCPAIQRAPDSIPAGTRVRVTAVEGRVLVVEKA